MHLTLQAISFLSAFPLVYSSPVPQAEPAPQIPGSVLETAGDVTENVIIPTVTGLSNTVSNTVGSIFGRNHNGKRQLQGGILETTKEVRESPYKSIKDAVTENNANIAQIIAVTGVDDAEDIFQPATDALANTVTNAGRVVDEEVLSPLKDLIDV